MLVLSRQRDETIMIGDDIELTVVDILGDKVRLGIKAPTRVAVHRKEIYDSIRRENEQAAHLGEREVSALPADARPDRRIDAACAAGCIGCGPAAVIGARRSIAAHGAAGAA